MSLKILDDLYCVHNEKNCFKFYVINSLEGLKPKYNNINAYCFFSGNCYFLLKLSFLLYVIRNCGKFY